MSLDIWRRVFSECWRTSGNERWAVSMAHAYTMAQYMQKKWRVVGVLRSGGWRYRCLFVEEERNG